MATVFISEVLNQFIIIVNAPLRVERSLKYISSNHVPGLQEFGPCCIHIQIYLLQTT